MATKTSKFHHLPDWKPEGSSPIQVFSVTVPDVFESDEQFIDFTCDLRPVAYRNGTSTPLNSHSRGQGIARFLYLIANDKASTQNDVVDALVRAGFAREDVCVESIGGAAGVAAREYDTITGTKVSHYPPSGRGHIAATVHR